MPTTHTDTAITSGLLEVGEEYEITTFETGDDFVLVGGSNQSGITFTATSTTPETWTNGSSLIKTTTKIYKDLIAPRCTADVFEIEIVEKEKNQLASEINKITIEID